MVSAISEQMNYHKEHQQFDLQKSDTETKINSPNF